jgi:hypothetical protein
MTNDIEKQSAGRGGATFVSTTGSPVNGEYCAIQCISNNTQFTSITMDALDGDTLDHNTHFPAGFTILGSIKSFTLHTGKVIAYKAVS